MTVQHPCGRRRPKIGQKTRNQRSELGEMENKPEHRSIDQEAHGPDRAIKDELAFQHGTTILFGIVRIDQIFSHQGLAGRDKPGVWFSVRPWVTVSRMRPLA